VICGEFRRGVFENHRIFNGGVERRRLVEPSAIHLIGGVGLLVVWRIAVGGIWVRVIHENGVRLLGPIGRGGL
jgi:hypothetical protein